MKQNKDVIVIGLTGGIGSGKSTVSNILKEMGAKVIDCDDLSRELIKDEETINDILAIFGQEVLVEKKRESDKVEKEFYQIDRKKLGDIVFNDKTKLKSLNLIMHNRISIKVDEILKNGLFGDVFILDIPIPIKEGFLDRCQVVWVVQAEYKDRLKRIERRDNISKEDIIKRINSQISIDDYNKFGDVIINNNGTIEDLRLLVKVTWEFFHRNQEEEFNEE